MRRFTLVFALLALALPTFAQQQQKQFEERIDVNAVLLDVIVTDPKGNQILGLGPDDFIVKENGVAQSIDSVDYFTNRRLLDSREEQAPFKVERVHDDRYFIFFFDKPSDPAVLFDQLTLAREAAKDFLTTQMQPTDRVAIAGHDVRLKIYSDFTSDKIQLARAFDEATKFGKGLDAPSATAGDGPSLLRKIDRKVMLDKTGTVYQALDLLADASRGIPARKNLVLFSPGVAEPDEYRGSEFLMSRSRYLDPMLQSLNAANVSVYAVQLQRTASLSPVFHQRLEEISETTGGRYYRFNTTFKPVLARIENVNNGYYLVTYRSKHAAGDTGFQKVNVSLRNPEFKVTARSGYQYGG